MNCYNFQKIREGDKFVEDIDKNSYNLFYRRDIEGFGLPMFPQKKSPDNFYSKTRLYKVF